MNSETRRPGAGLATDAAEHIDRHARAAIERIDRAAEDAAVRIEARAEAAAARLAAAFQKSLDEAGRQLIELQSRSESAAALGEKVVESVQSQARRSVIEMRASLEQIHQSAEQARGELIRAGESVNEASRRVADQINQHHQAIDERARQALAQVSLQAQQVQRSADMLLECGDNIRGECDRRAVELESAQVETRKLAEARSAELAAAAQSCIDELRELHAVILHDAEVARGSLAQAVAQHVAEIRRPAEQAAETVRELESQARGRATELLQQVQQIYEQITAELAGPRQVLESATRQSEVLARLSRTVSDVVRKLTDAGGRADERCQRLDRHSAAAEQHIAQIRSHTQRLGNLLGVIRQAHGSLAAHMQGLRFGLAQAEQFIQAPVMDGSSVVGSRGAATNSPVGGSPLKLAAKSPAATTSPISRAAPQRQAAPAANVPPGTLGDLVQKNQKLNAWLSEVLAEVNSQPTPAASMPAPPTSPKADRIESPSHESAAMAKAS